MKKLRTFAVSMIIAAIGLLIYCAGFYIKSYEQNLAARQEYAELSKMAGVKNREGAGLLAAVSYTHLTLPTTSRV